MFSETYRLNVLLASDQIDPMCFFIHFPSSIVELPNGKFTVSKVPSCKECEDFKANICEGKSDPITCFLELKQTSTHKDVINTLSKANRKVRRYLIHKVKKREKA